MPPPEKIDRKQQILAAALACFTETGLDATTIEMIRERSGASVGSMYHHFGNKENIAAALYAQAMESHHTHQQTLLSRARDAEEGVKALVYAYIDWISENPDLARFVFYGRSLATRAPAGAGLQKSTREHMSQILAWFGPHIEAGRIKRLPPECYSSLIIGPAHDYARLWLTGRARSDIRSYRDIFADAAWNAVKQDAPD